MHDHKIAYFTSGPLTSAAYLRATNLIRHLAKLNINACIIAGNRAENVDFALNNRDLKIFFYNEKNKYLSVIFARRLLHKVSPDYVIQLNPSLRGLFVNAVSKHKIICEWDEPRIFLNSPFWVKLLDNFLHYCFSKLAHLKISCTMEFTKYLPGSVYIPHGQYVTENYNISELPETFSTIVYLGNFYPLWDHEQIITSAQRLAKRGSYPKIIMIGGGPDFDYWKQFCDKEGLSNIEFTGYLNAKDWFPILATAKALLLPMSDTPLNRCRCSSKIFAYIKAKRPIYAHSVGEIPNIITRNATLLPPDTDLLDYAVNAEMPTIDYRCDDNITYPAIARRFLTAINNTNHE